MCDTEALATLSQVSRGLAGATGAARLGLDTPARPFSSPYKLPPEAGDSSSVLSQHLRAALVRLVDVCLIMWATGGEHLGGHHVTTLLHCHGKAEYMGTFSDSEVTLEFYHQAPLLGKFRVRASTAPLRNDLAPRPASLTLTFHHPFSAVFPFKFTLHPWFYTYNGDPMVQAAALLALASENPTMAFFTRDVAQFFFQFRPLRTCTRIYPPCLPFFHMWGLSTPEAAGL